MNEPNFNQWRSLEREKSTSHVTGLCAVVGPSLAQELYADPRLLTTFFFFFPRSSLPPSHLQARGEVSEREIESPRFQFRSPARTQFRASRDPQLQILML